MILLLALTAAAATIEAAAQAVMGQPVATGLFLAVAVATGLDAEREWQRRQRRKRGWS
jgi:hypothetical protein